MSASFLDGPRGKLAFHKTEGTAPTIVFLGGFMSDMDGTKALYLEDWAKAREHGFLRLDYSGHGRSDGAFEDGSIGDWALDAEFVITNVTQGPLILVGSSMGGWISLLMARKMPEKVAGMVTIAAAPDFTEDSMWAGFDASQRAALKRDGRIEIPSGYDDGPYVITNRLIEDGRDNLVLRAPLELPFPVRMLQGTADQDVDQSVALRLLDHANGPDIRLTLVKGADHRFSGESELSLISKAIHSVMKAAERQSHA